MPKTQGSPHGTQSSGKRWRVPPAAPSDGEHADTGAEAKRNAPRRSPEQAGAAKSRKHFVEPYPYSEEERVTIARALAGRGLGDATARDIFIGAIAYDLAVLKAAQAAGPAPAASAPVAPPAPAPRHAPQPPEHIAGAPGLAERALALAAAIDGLDPPARVAVLSALAAADPFRRDYGPDYLAALRTEVERLAGAAATITADEVQQAAPAAEPQRRPQRKPPGRTTAKTGSAAAESPPVIAFLRHAASVYEQCFDARPDPAPDAPFASVLAAVAAATQIAIPTDADLLRRALAER